MTKTKKELGAEIADLERKTFLNVYFDFDVWLNTLGFRSGAYYRESSTVLDYHWSHYEKSICSLNSVEHYVHDTLKLSIRFLRDRYEHKFMFVGQMGTTTNVLSITKTKELVLGQVRNLRDEQLAKLGALKNI